jgi:hypothetical protein
MNDATNSLIESVAEILSVSTPTSYNNANIEIQNSHSRITTNASSKLNLISVYS